jgi:hypothetical protein
MNLLSIYIIEPLLSNILCTHRADNTQSFRIDVIEKWGQVRQNDSNLNYQCLKHDPKHILQRIHQKRTQQRAGKNLSKGAYTKNGRIYILLGENLVL